jgi:iron complex outermembrane receptor protein
MSVGVGVRGVPAAAAVACALMTASPMLFAQSASSDQPLSTIPVDGPDAAVPEDSAASAADAYTLEEVVVTARKREEPAQRAPVSVTALSGSQLEAQGIDDLRSLGRVVAGLQMTDLAGYSLIYIRGIGTDAFIPSADPSIATYVDGISIPSGHSAAQAFGAVDRVEVLKGPQGTLFGRNSTGGAVAIWTRDPGPTPETSIQVSYARFDDTRNRLYTNIPLAEGLATSLSVFYNRADNLYRLDNGTGNDLPPEINKGARIKLGWALTDQLSLTLTGLAVDQSGTSTTTSANVDPSPILGASIPAETRDYVVTANSEPSLNTHSRGVYGKFEWDGAGVDAKLLGSWYRVNAFDHVYDFDGSSQPIATYGADSEYQRFVTSELQLTSDDETPGADWLKWVGGVYYLRSRGGYDPGYLRLVDSINLPISQIVDDIEPLLVDPLRSALLSAPIPSSLTFYFTGLVEAESISGYAQTTASLLSWVDLTLGGRWQRETRRLVQSDVSIETVDGGLGTLVSYPAESSTVTNFSPKVSLDLHPATDVLVYASYQKGFKSATYNIINIYTPPDYVKPERVTSYEVGYKSEWLDHTLRFNAAVFHNHIADLQTGFVSFTSGGAINFENAGSARIRGIEFESLWQPLPELDPGLVLGGSATWLEARYLDYPNGSGYEPTTGLAYRDDFSGNRIVRTPRFTAGANVTQRIAVSRGTFELAVDYAYNSGYYYLAQNSPNSFENAYATINARASYLHKPWSLRVTAFVDNLTDERYNLAQFHTDFGREDTLAPPITGGLRINYDY